MKAPARGTARRRKARPRRRARSNVVVRTVTPRPTRSRQKVLDVRCIVTATHGEAIHLKELAYGKTFMILVPTREQDGSAVALLGLHPGDGLWLSLQRARKQ